MAMVADIPVRPDGLELIGEMEGSGYRIPPALVRRHDGQTLQLTPLLYALLEAVDGRRGHEEIAELVSERTGRRISASDVATLAETQLRPRGLLLASDGSLPELKRSNPLTGLRLRFAVTDPVLTRRITAPFAVMFHPLVWIPLLALFAWIAWWLLVEQGLASATYQAFAKPDLLIVVLIVTILSAGLHEFGHAAAARRGGAQPGVMGAGWFLLWPAFYTDVTDTYRLGRAARLRTDLGGLYFNAIVAVAVAGAWWLTGWDALLLIVAAQLLQMIRQLAPLVRFDGYHVLADVTGVPDLFSRIWPVLTSFWPGRWNDPRVAQLKWWVRIIVTLWVLAVVPMLAFSLLAMVLAAPRVIGTALESIGREWGRAGMHVATGDFMDAAGAVLAMTVVTLPILAMAFVFGRVIYGMVRSLWRRTDGRPMHRTGAGALVLAAAVALALVWWPGAERYRPVTPFEDGTIFSVANIPLEAAGVERKSTTSARGGEVVAVMPDSGSLPTEDEPQMALVLVPRESEVAVDGADPGNTVGPAWVFPFNEPLPPAPGDNQAMTVNTTDGTASYDVAVAMVWVTGDEPVLNTNEAYAFASCSDCVTVAVAFQVVVIVGHADIIIPQNLSAAVNYECFECITAAVASQLVVTIDSLPDQGQQIALVDLWEDISAFAATIPTIPVADVIARLEDYKAEITAILGITPQVTPSPSASSLPSASSSPGRSGTPGPTPAPSPSGTPISSSSPTTGPTSSTSQGSPAATSTPTSGPTSPPTSSLTPSPTQSPTASP